MEDINPFFHFILSSLVPYISPFSIIFLLAESGYIQNLNGSPLLTKPVQMALGLVSTIVFQVCYNPSKMYAS